MLSVLRSSTAVQSITLTLTLPAYSLCTSAQVVVLERYFYLCLSHYFIEVTTGFLEYEFWLLYSPLGGSKGGRESGMGMKPFFLEFPDRFHWE